MARTFTITADDTQEQGLNWVLGRHNAALATRNESPITLDQLVVDVWAPGVLNDYVRQMKEADKAAVQAAMDDPAKVAAIKAAAGL